MRLNKELFFVLLLGMQISIVSSGISVSPATYDDFFVPGLNKSYGFFSNSNSNETAFYVTLEGDLVQYATLSSDYFVGGGSYVVTVNFPEKIDKPGTNVLYVGATEVLDRSQIGSVGARGKVLAPIRIYVPYPGKYIEGTFEVENANEGESINYALKINNLGMEDLTLSSKLTFYEAGSFEKKLYEVNINDTLILSKNERVFSGSINSTLFVPGDYFAYAEVDYGERKFFNDTFSVGEFVVKLLDYDYLFLSKKINSMNIIVKSFWNLPIKEVYSEIFVTSDGILVSSFKTPTETFLPWEQRNLTGFFDVTNLSAGRYLANLVLHFSDGIRNQEKSKLVAIYVRDEVVIEESKFDMKYVYWGVIIVLIILLLYLELKLNKLSGFIKQKYGKGK